MCTTFPSWQHERETHIKITCRHYILWPTIIMKVATCSSTVTDLMGSDNPSADIVRFGSPTYSRDLTPHGFKRPQQRRDQDSFIAFKSSIISGPNDILTKNWSANASIRSWIGVSCSLNHQRVTALSFSGFSFKGLSYNNFTGFMPNELSNLSRLELTDFRFNNLTGEIPSFGNNLKLRILNLWLGLSMGRILLDSFEYGCEWSNGYSDIFDSCKVQQTSDSSHGISNGILGYQKNTNFIAFAALRSEISNAIGWEISNLLQGNSLSGLIPFDIYKCSELMHLVLSFNHFSRSLTSSIGWLNKLQRLYVGVNSFQVKSFPFCHYLPRGVPSNLHNLSHWRELDAQGASLTGQIPSFIFNMSSLEQINFANNSLSGSLPLYHNLPNLEQLYLHSNMLIGDMPKSFGNLTMLNSLYLDHNNFTGELPSDLGNLNLVEIEVQHNGLSGAITLSIFNISIIEALWLSFNNFSGSFLQLLGFHFPTYEGFMWELGFLSSLTSCWNLQEIDLSNNPLNGLLPASTGSFSYSLWHFGASRCGIRGSIPVEMGNLTNVTDLYLDSNELTGFIPRTVGKLKGLKRIYLPHNNLQGFIPGDLFLSHNKLQGPIPECFSEIKSIQKLYLDFNKLESNVPSNVWNLNDLVLLNLSTNNLSGSFLSRIEKLKVISKLDLSFNSFSGNVPGDVDKAVTLDYLSLAHNKSQGSLPQSIGNLKSLEFLDLSCNSFSGFIPNSSKGLIYLKHFNVYYNKLEGKIPTGGNFANFNAESFLKNDGLCWETHLKIPHCGTSVTPRDRSAFRLGIRDVTHGRSVKLNR
ncbi:Leucine-rich repeat protein [Handroanthus impetiginosus]|uniref:Leucine-rich repeat protein n=1 Tax=Handroanthus impetiginosus TaxID=429701 RepID=A0A2G9G397_9LAMI|nr:Leucine-rich repeat protein [Handroanthus impetiginosus]